jgi:hypothetical protein
LNRALTQAPQELLHEWGLWALDDDPFDAVHERLTAASSVVHRLNSDIDRNSGGFGAYLLPASESLYD